MSEYTREEILKRIEENGGPGGLDLSGKDLAGIDLSSEAIQENLQQARKLDPEAMPKWFWGAPDLMGISLSSSNLRGANLQGAHLRRAYLEGADLQEADLSHAKLQGAYIALANLQGASLKWANLQVNSLWQSELYGASLEHADLSRVDLAYVKSLQGAFFYGVRLDHTCIDRRSLGPAIGEELARDYHRARDAYLRLKQNFDDLGDYAASSWAYRKERRMEKLEALQEAKEAWQKHDWKGAIPHYAKVAGDQLVEWVCDYGESVQRVLVSLVVVYVLFTLIYGLTWSVIRVRATPTATIREPTRNLVDLARFSLGAMTTMDLTGLEPRNGLVELLAGVEALLGIALTGLLGFVAGNRIRRS